MSEHGQRGVCVGLAGAGLLLLTACASGGATGPVGSPSATATPSRTQVTRSLATHADNGATMTVAPGSEVVVTLDSTYWTFAPVSRPDVLRGSTPRVGAPTRSVGRSIPGSGAGTVTETFRANAPGTASITASRRSCGEALRCSPAQSSYRLVVVVR